MSNQLELPIHFVVTGNDIQYQSWRRHHRNIKNCSRVTNRRQVDGVKSAILHLSYGYTWNEPSEVTAICEIVTMNGGVIVHDND